MQGCAITPSRVTLPRIQLPRIKLEPLCLDSFENVANRRLTRVLGSNAAQVVFHIVWS